MNQPATQRTDSFAELPGLLAEFGVHVEDVLGGTNLTVADLAPGRYVPMQSYLRVLDAAVARTGCEAFALLLGERQSIASLGPMSRVVRTAATLGDALNDMAAFQTRNSSGAAIYLHREGDLIFWGYGFYDPALVVSPHPHDLVLAAGTRILRELTQGRVAAQEFYSIRPRPRDPSAWRILEATVRFGQMETGLVIAAKDMALPLPSADPTARKDAIRELLAQSHLSAAQWTHRTRHALRGLLLEGRSSMPDVAENLAIHPRTLRRALARENTTFESVKDSVRLAVAHDLLAMSRLSVADISVALDFATSSAFIHAFRRWTGETPLAWRQRHRSPASRRAQVLRLQTIEVEPHSERGERNAG